MPNLKQRPLPFVLPGCDHTTVAAAIGAAMPGDVIDIQYTVHTEANITVDRNLTIQGQGQATTFLQAAATQAAAVDGVFVVQAGLTVVFQDLTIQNGNAINGGGSNSTLGGGLRISCDASSNISFNRVTILGNRANFWGGGIYLVGSNGTVSFTDCVIADNVANSIGNKCRRRRNIQCWCIQPDHDPLYHFRKYVR